MVHTQQSVTYVRHIATRMPVSNIDSLLRVMLGISTLLDTKGRIMAFKTIATNSTRRVYKTQVGVGDTLMRATSGFNKVFNALYLYLTLPANYKGKKA